MTQKRIKSLNPRVGNLFACRKLLNDMMQCNKPGEGGEIGSIVCSESSESDGCGYHVSEIVSASVCRVCDQIESAILS